MNKDKEKRVFKLGDKVCVGDDVWHISFIAPDDALGSLHVFARKAITESTDLVISFWKPLNERVKIDFTVSFNPAIDHFYTNNERIRVPITGDDVEFAWLIKEAIKDGRITGNDLE